MRNFHLGWLGHSPISFKVSREENLVLAVDTAYTRGRLDTIARDAGQKISVSNLGIWYLSKSEKWLIFSFGHHDWHKRFSVGQMAFSVGHWPMTGAYLQPWDAVQFSVCITEGTKPRHISNGKDCQWKNMSKIEDNGLQIEFGVIPMVTCEN